MSDAALWVYLSRSPLAWLTATLGAYALADAIADRLGRPVLLNPVALAVAMLGTLLWATGTPYALYFEGAQFVHFLLGPATVALALPLFRHRREVARALRPIAAALLAGAVTAVVSALAVASVFGLPAEVQASLAPKSVTAAIAMAVSQELGGDPALTASLVITTGVLGAILVLPLSKLFRVRDPRARGFAAGLAAHGIGTAQVLRVDPLAGAFAAIAMGLNGVATSAMAPLLAAWFRARG